MEWGSQNFIFKKSYFTFINLMEATSIFSKNFTKDFLFYPCL